MKYILTAIFLSFIISTIKVTDNSSLISISQLLKLKNSSNEEIHDFLILNNWEFVETNEEGSDRAIIPLVTKTQKYEDFYSQTYLILKNDTYYVIGSRGSKIDRRKREIYYQTLDAEIYKNILQDLYNNNYKILGQARELGDINIAASSSEDLGRRMKKDFVRTGTSARTYVNGKSRIEVYISTLQKFVNGKTLTRNEYKVIIPL